MIALLGRDDYSVLGVAAIFDVEKIPHRRIGGIAEAADAPLVVTAGELTPADIHALAQRPAVILGGGLAAAHHLCNARTAEVCTRPGAIALSEPVWAADTVALARAHGKAFLDIPLAPVCQIAGVARGTVLATLVDGASRNGGGCPAIVQAGPCLWSSVDVGAAFANLLTERYLPEHKRHAPSSVRAWSRRAAETLYYAAPDVVRRWVQSRSYALLERQLSRSPLPVSQYPSDGTGWLLIELLKTLVRRAAGTLVRLERWPAPYRAAATLTHDIEPRRYAYTTGLGRLLQHEDVRCGTSALGLVAAASDRYLTDESVRQLNGHEVLCHGLEHRGEPASGRAQVASTVQTARNRLERRLARTVRGYRSPRLDRSDDLLWALDRCGFSFDSSYPDVDRENVKHFGGGVRLNLPYRPLLIDGGSARPSRCLELPLTAPDCIQPLLAGQEAAELRATVAEKARFVRDTGGVYVALVHAGVFGWRDAQVREDHLRFVAQQLQHPDVWLAGIGDIAEWWCGREALRVTVDGGAVRVTNHADTVMQGVRLVIERRSNATTFLLPALEPGASAPVPL